MLSSYNPYLTYYPAIITAAIFGGFFAGLFATAMTCIIVSLLCWLRVSEPFIKVPSDWLAYDPLILELIIIFMLFRQVVLNRL